MMMRLVALLLLLGPWAAHAKCMPKAECEKHTNELVEDIRARILDHIQQLSEPLVNVAPTATLATAIAVEDGMLPADLSVSTQRTQLQDHFWLQIKTFPELDWVYAGSGKEFIGYRRPLECEISRSCSSSGSLTYVTPAPTVGDLVHLEWSSGVGLVSSTINSNTGEPVSRISTDSSFNTEGRTWYTTGLKLSGKASDVSNYDWTSVYPFSGGALGLTAMRKATLPTGGMVILAADYNLQLLKNFTSIVPPQDNYFTYMIDADGDLLATSLDIPVVQNGKLRKASSITSSPLGKSATNLLVKFPILGQRNSDWSSSLLQSVSRTTYEGRSLEVIAIADPLPDTASSRASLKWVIAVDSVTSFFYSLNVEESGCVSQFECRDVIQALATDLLLRTITQLSEAVNNYLQTAIAAVNSLDLTYNLGHLSKKPCNPTCGSITLTDSSDRAILQKYLYNILTKIFPELQWVYLGTKDKQFLGYYRSPTDNSIQLWECLTVSPSCQGSAFYPVDNNGNKQTPAVRTNQTAVPTDRAWYKTGENRAFDNPAWTVPYVFGTGEVGVTAVRPMFGGGFTTTELQGVWGADFSLGFINKFIADFSFQETEVVTYLMDQGGNIIAGSANCQCTSPPHALYSTLKSDNLVRKTGSQMMKTKASWSTSISELVFTDPTGTYYINYVLLKDTSLPTGSYEWLMVQVAREEAMYTFTVDTSEDSDDEGVKAWTIAVIVVFVVVAIAVIALAVKMFVVDKQ